MRRMSCPTISSIGLLERKRLFNFFTALHLLLATKDGGQRGSRAACCFLSWTNFLDLDQITSVVVYVADERAPISAGRDKAAQNVDIIVQRSVHRQLNIQQFWKAWHCSLHTSGGTAPGSLLMGSRCPFSKARQAAFLSVAPALCVSLLQDFKTRIIVGMFQLWPRWVQFFLADIGLHLEVGSFDNNSNLAIALDADNDNDEWMVGTWSVLDNAFSTRWWTELDFLVVPAFQGCRRPHFSHQIHAKLKFHAACFIALKIEHKN